MLQNHKFWYSIRKSFSYIPLSKTSSVKVTDIYKNKTGNAFEIALLFQKYFSDNSYQTKLYKVKGLDHNHKPTEFIFCLYRPITGIWWRVVTYHLPPIPAILFPLWWYFSTIYEMGEINYRIDHTIIWKQDGDPTNL